MRLIRSIRARRCNFDGWMWTASAAIMAMAASAGAACAQSQTPAAVAAIRNAPTVAPVEVERTRRDDTPAKLDHISPEVDGAKITVTKKTNVTKLDQQPTLVDNNLQQLFARSPGLLVTQQQTPTQFNLSYRGLGNPQESEYVLVMQDGLPITTDWIGFPTLYYMPLPQGISEVQELRGGSSLLYGPEPAPVINFISKRPRSGEPLTGYTEQAGGSDGLYSTYNVLEGTNGALEYRFNFGYVHSNGQRDNARSDLRQGDIYLGWRPDGKQNWGLSLHVHSARSGDPGKINFAQFHADPSFSPTPYNEDWVSRYSLVLNHERDFGSGWRFEGKAYASYQELTSRAAAAQAVGGPRPVTTTLQDDIFRNEGADLRLRKRYGRGNAFTVGVELYRDSAPFRQWISPNLMVQPDDHSGTARLHQFRNSSYESIFAENVWRLPGRFHLVPSVRLEHEKVEVHESVKPANLARPLINVDADKSIPLFGIGVGNDFGHQNETYFSITQGWRPLRYFDVGSPFANIQPGNIADPSKSLTFEGGVHGTPIPGLFYDAGLFWIDFKNRIETITLSPVEAYVQNSGDTRNRGFEGELSYDFMAGKSGGKHLTMFGNLQLLDAKFTRSSIAGQVGKTPAFAPHMLAKYGLTWRQEGLFSLSVTGVSVSSQYFQDSNLPAGTGASLVPARIPAYTVLDVAGDFYITRKVRLLGGVSNIGDRRYYSRIFQNGIEPAKGRTYYAGLALGF